MSCRVAGERGWLAAADLHVLLRDCAFCGPSAPLFDSPEFVTDIGTIEVGEGVQLLEHQVGADGSEWARCILLHEGSTVWVLRAGGNCSSNFGASDRIVRVASIEAHELI